MFQWFVKQLQIWMKLKQTETSYYWVFQTPIPNGFTYTPINNSGFTRDIFEFKSKIKAFLCIFSNSLVSQLKQNENIQTKYV